MAGFAMVDWFDGFFQLGARFGEWMKREAMNGA